MKYLLDTDICSYMMKRSHPALLARLRTISPEDTGISVITRAELEYGVEMSPRRLSDRRAVDDFLQFIEILAFPVHAAIHYGQIRAVLQRKGNMIGANDLFIAAHARCLDLVLVTNNAREFKRIPGLKIENWI